MNWLAGILGYSSNDPLTKMGNILKDHERRNKQALQKSFDEIVTDVGTPKFSNNPAKYTPKLEDASPEIRKVAGQFTGKKR